MELQTNCSEIVGKVGGLRTKQDYKTADINIDTSIYPNEAVQQLVALLEEEKIDDLDDLDIENVGGGGDMDYVEGCFDLAKKVVSGELDMDEAEFLESLSCEESDISKKKEVLLTGSDKDIEGELKDMLDRIRFDKLMKILKIPKESIPKLKKIATLVRI